MVIGVERILAHKTAGMRTYALVSMGSALFVMLSELLLNANINSTGFNPAHIPAAIITGIGFLGAGVIIFKDNQVTGVTTASSIWVVAGIGMAVGFRFYSLAIIVTVLTLFVFIVLWFIEQKIKNLQKYHNNDVN